MASIYRLHDGHTVADLKEWRKKDEADMQGPAEALGGALDSRDISHLVWLRKNFTPGHYVLHCEMPVINTPAESKMKHDDLGMVREFEIND